MGDIGNYVNVTVTSNTIGITNAGFGTFLYLSQNASGAARSKTYLSDAAVATDYANVRSPERRVSAAFFGQAQSTGKLKFGRRVNKSTIVYQVSVATLRNSYTYSAFITGDSFDRTPVTFTSDSTATDAEIAAGLVIAFNAVAGKNYTASGAASPISLTSSAAGNWFEVEIAASATATSQGSAPDDLLVVQTHADPGVTADLVAIAAEDPDFYMVYNTSNSSAEATAISTWVESNKRTFMCVSDQTTAISTAASGGTDLFKALNTSAVTRTYCLFHHRLDQMAGAALAGLCLSFNPGTEAWHDKNLALVDPTWLTQTHRQNLLDRKANGYEGPVAGIGVTFGGTCANGGYLDIVRLLDAFRDYCAKQMFRTKTINSKVGYDDAGIQLLVNDFRGSINHFAGDGQGFDQTSIVIVYPLASAVPSADRTARVLNGISGNVRAVGAIATVNVTINVSA